MMSTFSMQLKTQDWTNLIPAVQELAPPVWVHLNLVPLINPINPSLMTIKLKLVSSSPVSPIPPLTV